MNCSENDTIQSALQTLADGGVLLYPTDTIWGIGCDATSTAAVERVYAVKQRDHSKSMLVLCADLAMVERFVGRVGERTRALLMASDRPTTVIMPMQGSSLASNLVAADGTIGVRLPQMDFCQHLLRAFGKPIVSTSANLSGRPSPRCHADIEETIIKAADYAVAACFESGSRGSASRIVKAMPDGKIAVIRPA